MQNKTCKEKFSNFPENLPTFHVEINLFLYLFSSNTRSKQARNQGAESPLESFSPPPWKNVLVII